MADEETDELSEAIEQSATEGIARAQGDSGSMEEHSLTERIAADRYLKTKDASKKGAGGARYAKFVPPGTV
jgi:hypothetical protein